MTAKEALNKLDLNIGEISPAAHNLCMIIKKELEELDRYRQLCYGDLKCTCSSIALPNGVEVQADTGYIDDFFNDSDVKKWLNTGK